MSLHDESALLLNNLILRFFIRSLTGCSSLSSLRGHDIQSNLVRFECHVKSHSVIFFELRIIWVLFEHSYFGIAQHFHCRDKVISWHLSYGQYFFHCTRILVIEEHQNYGLEAISNERVRLGSIACFNF